MPVQKKSNTLWILDAMLQTTIIYRVLCLSAWLGSVCSYDSAITGNSIPAVVFQQIQVRETEQGTQQKGGTWDCQGVIVNVLCIIKSMYLIKT